MKNQHHVVKFISPPDKYIPHQADNI